MPSNQSPLGALPARFRRERLLIIGCGDVGTRVLRALQGRMQVLALTSSPQRVPALRAAGARALIGDLDAPATLHRLAGLGTRVLHLAPPPRADEGEAATHEAVVRDRRTEAVVRLLRQRTPPLSLVYGSTSGVYGDCEGARVPETRGVQAGTARALRRVAAERQVRWLGRGLQVRTGILRIPGIYAPDREGGTPRARLLRGTPVLQPQDDVFTNHIHADDLARACIAALYRARGGRVFHVSDDSELQMGDYFDLAAGLYGLPCPPRVARAEAQQQLTPMQLSFMSESRRLDNRRMKRELGVRLRYPTVREGLAAS
ncbi:NAD-binding protein [Xenophilus arseniciresistens]|uniref:NAD-binding protein n=1 Tax=Xenophilus arseniciresistens TaxID=1283306 RepID=A0AAE3N581_9BURK|nr:NAD-dependent epimerase/dehydratase family protein [Xenophilus arseniciresistens]MDA7415456.1 NAD-binding protein [Xenophilus arseniciresistens]